MKKLVAQLKVYVVQILTDNFFFQNKSIKLSKGLTGKTCETNVSLQGIAYGVSLRLLFLNVRHIENCTSSQRYC